MARPTLAPREHTVHKNVQKYQLLLNINLENHVVSLITIINTMNRSFSPALFLEASASPMRQAARVKIHWLDYAFFTLVLIMICGGALFMLELGSTHSSGQSSILGQLIQESSTWLTVAAQKVSYYGILFLASVVNSALMVLFVQVLRTLDRRFSRSMQRRWPSTSVKVPARPVNHVSAKPLAQNSIEPLHRSFLLCPITR